MPVMGRKNPTMQFQIYPTVEGLLAQTQWRWRLLAANNRVIAAGESYHNRQDCVDAVNLVMNTTTKTSFVETKS